jgi:hypothetical protein
MSPRIAGMHIAVVLTLLGATAAADVAPLPAATLLGPGPAPVCPAVQQTGPTEVDKAYYYSTIGQELAYAKVREDAARQADKVSPSSRPQTGLGLRAPSPVSPLSPILCPPVCVLCPSPSRLMSRLDAAGCTR